MQTKHAVGDLVAIVRFTKVTKVQKPGIEGGKPHTGIVNVIDVDNDDEFRIVGSGLIDKLRSAAIFTKTEKVPLTQAASLVSSSFNMPVTVCFLKKDDSERVLVGRLSSSEPLLGRSYYEDLNCVEANKLRLVDHRTLQWLIVNGTKYVVK
jgi:hypothetical protein